MDSYSSAVIPAPGLRSFTANIDRSFYSRIELGKKGCSVDILVRISNLFETSLDFLVLGKEENWLLKMEAAEDLKTDIAKLISRLQAFTSKL